MLYILVAAVLTGMVPYHQIDLDAPVAQAFAARGLPTAQLLISLGAVVGITSVLLVLLLSQARILLAMARDGLISRSFFGAVHPRFRTPHKATILTGILVGARRRALPAEAPRRPGEHRHADGVRHRVRRRHRHAAHESRRCTGRSARRSMPWVPIVGMLMNLAHDVLARLGELAAARRLAR